MTYTSELDILDFSTYIYKRTNKVLGRALGRFYFLDIVITFIGLLIASLSILTITFIAYITTYILIYIVAISSSLITTVLNIFITRLV